VILQCVLETSNAWIRRSLAGSLSGDGVQKQDDDQISSSSFQSERILCFGLRIFTAQSIVDDRRSPSYSEHGTVDITSLFDDLGLALQVM